MRLTLQFAGLELDITLGRSDNEPDDDDPGSFTSYPVGFVRDVDPPFEYDVPHRFAPGEGDEDT